MNKIHCYTSYYANKNILEQNYLLFSISNSVPKYLNYSTFKIKIFVPSWSIVNNYKLNLIDEDEYTRLYLKQLETIDFTLIYNHMLSYDKIPVFLCYEGKNKFCHRHILSKYMNSTNLFDVHEL